MPRECTVTLPCCAFAEFVAFLFAVDVAPSVVFVELCGDGFACAVAYVACDVDVFVRHFVFSARS